MKKIIMAVAAIAMAVSLFAADVSIALNAGGSIAKGKIDFTAKEDPTVDVLTWDDFGFKDGKDLMALAVSGDKAGAKISVGTANSAQRDDLNIRYVNLWFKPIDMIKVTVGNIDEQKTYCERLDWWKASAGENAYTLKSYTWSSYASVEGIGFNVNVNPIPGLDIGVGVTPGAGATFWSLSEKENYASYGVYAKYQILDFISAGVAWRDEGKDKRKIASIGADFGNWGTPYYGFLNVRILMEQPASLTEGKIRYSWNMGITGIAFDNFVKYNLGFMTIEGRFPVVVRGLMVQKKGNDIYAVGGTPTKGAAVNDVDPSYLRFGLRVTFPISFMNVYCYIHNDNGALVFNSKLADNLALTVKPGVTMNIGACALDLALQADFSQGFKGMDWSVPCTAKITF